MAGMVAGCTYDFDAPFAETPVSVGGGTSSGGSGGTAGAGATGGMGATGGNGGATPTGGTGGSSGEVCTNAVDDDGDLLVDCQDPDCGAFACAALPPANWVGPIAFALVPGTDPLPACASEWPTNSEAFGQLQPSPLDCTACTCGAPAVSCGLANTDSYTTSACSGLEASISPLGDGICTPFDLNDMDGLRPRPPSVVGNPSCASGGGGVTVTEPAWGAAARLCSDAPLGAGCDAGSVCLPAATVSFALCITRSGDEICPPGYPQKTLLYSSFEDHRSCSACGCAAPTGVSCDGQTEVWESTQSCAGVPDHIYVNDNSCNPTGRNIVHGSLRYQVNGTADGCNPTGGSTEGWISPTEPITVCCSS